MEAVARKHLKILALLFFLTLLVFFFSLMQGTADIPLSKIFQILGGKFRGEGDFTIIWDIRLPRVLLAVAVGGGLSVAGAVFQAILLNPLAEPYILGISGGGAFGAMIAIAFGLSFWVLQGFSFIGAFVVILAVFSLGKKAGMISPNALLLTGVMVGAFFSALILLTVTLMHNSLRTALFWLMGSLSFAQITTVWFVLAISLVISFYLSLNGERLNLITLGDEQAESLGVNVKQFKKRIYFLTSLLVGGIVSVSGIIGFVGLIVPHVSRLFFGPDNKIVVPASFFFGSIFLLFADFLSRNLIPPSEIPVGAITAVVGAPFFVYLLKKKMEY